MHIKTNQYLVKKVRFSVQHAITEAVLITACDGYGYVFIGHYTAQSWPSNKFYGCRKIILSAAKSCDFHFFRLRTIPR